MKVILTEKINKLGNIGDTVDVKTGYARNFLLPNGKAMRFSKENVALFETKKAELQAKQDAARKTAESQVAAVAGAKLHMIRQAGDTGQLYGSVSSRDIARMLTEITNIKIDSAQVLMGSPIKSVGAFETKIALHPDVIVPVKIYVAQTQDEIDALVAGKVLTFGSKRMEEEATNDDADFAADAAAQEAMDDVVEAATTSPEVLAENAEEAAIAEQAEEA